MSKTAQQPRSAPHAANSPLGKLYRKRVAQNRDLTVLISDWNLERGSGKTTLALRMAAACDRTEEGVTPDKATLSAAELENVYTSESKGSSLLLDEAEAGVSNRRSMSGVNEAMRRIIGMGRVEQKYLFFTTPGAHQVDKDIRAMCDIWIFVRKLGEGQMFRVKYNPFEQHEIVHNWGTIKWSGGLPGPLEETYEKLTAEKRRRLRGEEEEGEGYVEAADARKKADKAAEEAERQKRDELLREIYTNAEGMTQQKLADSVGLSRSRIADIVRGDDGK